MTQPGTNSSFDFKSVPRPDLILLGAGLLTLIFGFFPFVGVSAGRFSVSSSGWTGLGLLAELLVLAATVIVAIDVFASNVLPRTAPWNVIVAGAAILAVILFLIKLLTHHLCVGGACGSSGVGVKVGGILTLIAAAVFALCAFMRLRASGEAMPWENRGTAPPPAA